LPRKGDPARRRVAGDEGSSETSKASRASRASSTARRVVKPAITEDIDRVVGEVSEELIAALGLQGLFEVGDLRDLVEGVVRDLVEEGRRVDKSLLVKRFTFYKEEVYKYLARKALEAGSLNEELAEFIVYSAPEIAGKAASWLYGLVKGSSAALDMLRSLWLRYGRPTPLICPVCNFSSLAPDLTCLICGSTPSEEDVKKANNFEEELKSAIKEWHRSLVEEVIRAGYVYYDYNDREIKPPSMAKPGGAKAQITLNVREKMMLREYLSKLEDRS
jgi:hypothetical protein